MEVGAIGFKDEKQKKYVNDVHKIKDILKVILKTEKEEHPDL